MSIGVYIFFVGALIPLCFAATQTISYNGLAVTLIPGSPNPTLGLAPLNINDPNQQWVLPTASNPVISSGNPDYANYVWDVNQNSVKEGTKIILYPKKPGNDPNQDWTISNGVITSLAAKNFTVAGNGSSNLYMTYNPPAQATIQNPIISMQCSSVGDPHITPYPGGRNDLYSPGSQQPGTYTLSKTGVVGDPDYLIVQADQQLCRPNVAGVYCNKRGILKTLGHVIEVAGDKVTIDGVVTSVTGTLQVGNGVNVTKLGTNNYVISFPNGKVQFQTISYYGEYYITLTHGPVPTGGVCTPIVGPNYPATSQTSSAQTVAPKLKPYDFCLSWRARNMSEDLFSYSDYLSWRAANPLNFTTSEGNCTTANETLQAIARSACASLAPNSPLGQQCAAIVTTAPINFVYQACLDDVICMKDPSFGPSSTDAYAKRCSADGGSSIVLPTSGANSIAEGPGITGNITLSFSPISFNITARDVNGKIIETGTDNFVVTSTGGFSFNITYLGAGIYRVTYIPNVIGTFNISVSLDGIADVLNNPFTVSIFSNDQVTDPARSTAFGPGLNPTVPKGLFQRSFTIVARSADGAQRTSGGDFVHFISDQAITKGVIDNNDGTYTATYLTPLFPSQFRIWVEINLQEIMGSPFVILAV
eukprot:Phypoly_transcript_04775.p1 GENE.Phypoly_transcript_04775~~Phypoly_transcript_04775.p1  ORF type:complete len:646 (+),score=95.14 Phypoly_transcript_04775:107-2044(+)